MRRGIRLAVYRWGEPGTRPPLLLSHGTGFCASVWQSVAEALAPEFVVYALDRRGHGASSKPADAYHFADFADDILSIVEQRQLTAAHGLAHSAGATDLLLAAARKPSAFHSLFAMEPTVITPADSSHGDHADRLGEALRRRATFPSLEQAIEHYRTRGIFRAWLPELLQAYVHHAFEALPDGSVTLRCAPAIEHAILVHIVAAMSGKYLGDRRGDPFARFANVRCPTRITTTEGSQPIFKHMAEAARQRIPHATAHHFQGVGHCVAQIEPEAVVLAARSFWASVSG